MTVFVDTAVIMYAVGTAHPLKAASAEILRRVASGAMHGVTSAEVIQEIVHRFVHAGRPERAAEVAGHALAVFSPVVPVSHAVAERLPGLLARYPNAAARDLLHVATCLEERIGTIVTPDRDFDGISELRRADPADPATLALRD